MRHFRAGDTLIEVLFAFTILSTVIGVMFSGALGSYKSALNAQDRTTALFLAQYQADGLKSYRDSIAWDQASGQQYTFLDADGGAALGDSATQKSLVVVRSLATNNTSFCMNQPSSSYIYWKIITVASDCKSIASALAPSLQDADININIALANDGNSATATVKVKWRARNSRQIENVTNTILLTKQK
jgi:hypothetical protein